MMLGMLIGQTGSSSSMNALLQSEGLVQSSVQEPPATSSVLSPLVDRLKDRPDRGRSAIERFLKTVGVSSEVAQSYLRDHQIDFEVGSAEESTRDSSHLSPMFGATDKTSLSNAEARQLEAAQTMIDVASKPRIDRMMDLALIAQEEFQRIGRQPPALAEPSARRRKKTSVETAFSQSMGTDPLQTETNSRNAFDNFAKLKENIEDGRQTVAAADKTRMANFLAWQNSMLDQTKAKSTTKESQEAVNSVLYKDVTRLNLLGRTVADKLYPIDIARLQNMALKAASGTSETSDADLSETMDVLSLFSPPEEVVQRTQTALSSFHISIGERHIAEYFSTRDRSLASLLVSSIRAQQEQLRMLGAPEVGRSDIVLRQAARPATRAWTTAVVKTPAPVDSPQEASETTAASAIPESPPGRAIECQPQIDCILRSLARKGGIPIKSRSGNFLRELLSYGPPVSYSQLKAFVEDLFHRTPAYILREQLQSGLVAAQVLEEVNAGRIKFT